MPGVAGEHPWCLVRAELERGRVTADEKPQVGRDEHGIVTADHATGTVITCSADASAKHTLIARKHTLIARASHCPASPGYEGASLLALGSEDP